MFVYNEIETSVCLWIMKLNQCMHMYYVALVHVHCNIVAVVGVFQLWPSFI